MNTLPTVSTTSHPPKIRDTHLDRLAYIYVRQSSPKQVAQNRESQLLQYQLAQRAESLGWRADRVRTIDSDQGLSGKTSAGRDGFQELVAEVSLGRVGIIFGYQVSRLARNNSDWYHLLDVAAVFDTLIADSDGIYDLRVYNDRLLLGLKGTMSEAELYWLRQRLDAGRLNQIQRGAYRQGLPTGLVRLEDGRVMKDPDDQVRHAIELVLVKFEELGTCGAVLRYLRREDIRLPRRQPSGLFPGELLWKPATDSTIYEMVRNPAYAGAFAYGRRQVDYTRQIPGQPTTGRLSHPMTDWLYMHQDVYPAYIGWEQYLANQERLHHNAMRFTPHRDGAQGAAREGAALLQGLMRCGHCGRAMRVGYRRQPHYACTALAKHTGEPSCLWVAGAPVEAVVQQAFFEALRPANIDALAAVLTEQQTNHDRLVQHWDARLQRGRYEVQVAQRHYNAVDPENRLVAAELERRWESALQSLQETQDAYDRFQRTPRPTTLPPDLRTQLTHLSQTLPELWPRFSHDQQKALLRSLIAHVICRRDTPDRLEVRVVWVSGHCSILYAQVPVLRGQDLPQYAQLVARVEVLWQQGLTDAQMAAQLTGEGFHSARQAQVNEDLVKKIRLDHGWYLTVTRSRQALEVEGYLTVRGLAARLGVAPKWVHNRLRSRTIPPTFVIRHPHRQVLLIRNDPEVVQQLRQILTENR